jgi:hypothetical protein
MQKSRMKKRWIWLAAVAGLTAIVMVVQSMPGTGRSRKNKKM